MLIPLVVESDESRKREKILLSNEWRLVEDSFTVDSSKLADDKIDSSEI